MKSLQTTLAAALAGAAVAVAIALPISLSSGGTKTVVEQAPLAAANAVTKTSGLTPREIYKRDAPGVVFVTAQIVQQSQSPFDPFPQQQQGRATGSGFVINRDGT